MPRLDGTGPPDGRPGWGAGPCGMGHARDRMNRPGRTRAGQSTAARACGGRRAQYWRDFSTQPQGMPSPSLEETEQLKRDLAAARKEVAELRNRLGDLEQDNS